MTFIYITQI